MDHRAEPRSRRKACSRCITAKARCAIGPGLENCERCMRLQKDCSFDEVERPKGKNYMRIDKLEEQVKGLTALLASGESITSVPDSSARMDYLTPPLSASQLPGLQNRQSYSSPLDPDIVDRGLVTISQAEELLRKFRTVKAPYFPFVMIPEEINATTLLLQSPFLFLVVITVSLEDDLSLQRILGDEIKKVVSKRVILDNERELELLQGLLVCVAWYHYQFKIETQQIWLFIHIASALITSMNLNRSPIDYENRIGNNYTQDEEDSRIELEKRKSAAQKRAVLGYHYLFSVLSLFRKEIPSKHTLWIEQCCRTLAADNEYSTDTWLQFYIGSQSLARRVCEAFSREGPSSIDTMNTPVVEMSIKMFQQELVQLEAKAVSIGMDKNYYFVLELKTLTIIIHEIVLQHHSLPAENFSPSHIQHLWTLLSSSRDLISTFSELPTSVMKQLPMPLFHMLSYGFVVLSKVLLLPSTNGWDASVARRESKIGELAVTVHEKIESLSRTGIRDVEKDFWSYVQIANKSMLAWLEGQILAGEADPSQDISSQVTQFPIQTTHNFVAEGIYDYEGVDQQSAGLERIQEADWSPEIWQNMMDEFCLIPDIQDHEPTPTPWQTFGN